MHMQEPILPLIGLAFRGERGSQVRAPTKDWWQYIHKNLAGPLDPNIQGQLWVSPQDEFQQSQQLVAQLIKNDSREWDSELV